MGAGVDRAGSRIGTIKPQAIKAGEVSALTHRELSGAGQAARSRRARLMRMGIDLWVRAVDRAGLRIGTIKPQTIKAGEVSALAQEHSVQVGEGRAEITISGAPHTLEEGEMILMRANQPHSLKALSAFKMMLTMIRS